MSPPIRDGSGSSIGSIRLGDGSEIAEVRTGAGDVVFTADRSIDNFESAPDGIYKSGDTISTYYSNDVSAAQRATSPVDAGSNSLELNTGSSDNTIVSLPGDGLNRYFGQGDTIRLWAKLNAGDVSFMFGKSTTNAGFFAGDNGYAAVIRAPQSTMRLFRFQNGTHTTLTSTSQSISLGTEFGFEVDWTVNGQITFRLFDASFSTQLNSIQTTDSTYSAEGVGFGSNNNGSSGDNYFDSVRIV